MHIFKCCLMLVRVFSDRSKFLHANIQHSVRWALDKMRFNDTCWDDIYILQKWSNKTTDLIVWQLFLVRWGEWWMFKWNLKTAQWLGSMELHACFLLSKIITFCDTRCQISHNLCGMILHFLEAFCLWVCHFFNNFVGFVLIISEECF